MPKNKLFLPVSVKMKVEVTRKSVSWWMKPYSSLALFFVRLGCRMANAEILVSDQPKDWATKTPEVNMDAFMGPRYRGEENPRSEIGDIG